MSSLLNASGDANVSSVEQLPGEFDQQFVVDEREDERDNRDHDDCDDEPLDKGHSTRNVTAPRVSVLWPVGSVESFESAATDGRKPHRATQALSAEASPSVSPPRKTRRSTRSDRCINTVPRALMTKT